MTKKTLQEMGVPLEVASYILKLETNLREVRREGQHGKARRIIDEALGDTWEQENGYTRMKGGYLKVLALESRLDYLLNRLIASVRVDERAHTQYTIEEVVEIKQSILNTVEKITYRA